MLQRRPLFAGLVLALATLVSVLWIDRPLALFFAQFHLGHAVFTNPSLTLPVMIVIAWAGVLTGAEFLVARRPMPRWIEAGMLAGIALLASLWLTHEVLKPIFGRSVPSLLIQRGQYGFHWFHHGHPFGSFPSGHTDQAAAILTVAWLYFPRWRWVYLGLLGLLALALMLGQWHFLGDILAGAMVGAGAGALAVRLWRVARGGAGRWRASAWGRAGSLAKDVRLQPSQQEE